MTQTTIRSNVAVLNLRFGEEVIGTTSEHPFYIEGKGFVKAGELGVGTSIVTRAGPSLKLEASTPSKTATVYNCTVEGFHTYFVGKSKIWVHNVDCVPTPSNIWPHNLDELNPALAELLRKFRTGADKYGQSVKGIDITGKIIDELDAYLAQRGFTRQPDGVVYGQNGPITTPEFPNGLPQRYYTHPDGGVVRVKEFGGDPNGQGFTGPQVNKYVMRNPAGDTSWLNEAFKVDRAGNPIPRHPDEAWCPFNKETERAKWDAWMAEAMGWTHIPL